MPEDTSGENTEPKTFTQEEVDAIRAEGVATGQKESHSHFQSVFDKEIAKVKTESLEESGRLNTSIREMRAASLENLPEGERSLAMIKEMYEEHLKPAPASSASDKLDLPGPPNQGDSQQAMQNAINESLKDLGLDTSKINWGEGNDPAASMKTFLGSVVEQVKEGAKSESSSSGDKSGDKEGDEKESQKHIDTSRGTGDAQDITQRDPQSLVAQDEWKPIRGMMDS